MTRSRTPTVATQSTAPADHPGATESTASPDPAALAASADAVAAYRDALVPWYRANARDLPWRRNPEPWGVWVSEMMLQQTRMETVIPYWRRFLERFPDPQSLAEASEEDVLEAWSGLGYYRRARLLQAGARRVVEEHGGAFPADERAALAIPGVGRYTAGAIRSIALGLRAPILDGNVIRVLTRRFGIAGDPGKAAVSKPLWAISREVVAAGDPSEVNQAQMELGALVCTPRDPVCVECPLAKECVAHRDGRWAELPELPPRRKPVDVQRTVLLVRSGGYVLLRRRLPTELLPGMWDLPGAFGGGDEGAAATRAADTAAALLPFPVRLGAVLGTVRHAITHRRIRLEVVEATAGPIARTPLPPGPDGAELAWRTPEEVAEAALSSPARRILTRWPAGDSPAGRPPS